MGNSGLIIFLVIIAIQVVAGIIQKVAKDKNKPGQAAKRKPAQRRAAGQPPQLPQPTRPPQRGVPGGAPTTPAGGSRLDDLAARRRTQLEELRRRRGATQVKTGQKPTVGPATPPAGAQPRARGIKPIAQGKRPGQTTARATGRGQAPAARAKSGAPAKRAKIQELGTGLDALRADEQAERRRRDEELRRKHAAEEAHARRDAQREARDAKQRLQARKRREAEEAARRKARAEHRARVRKLLAQGGIRDAIVLREILDEPVSMRPMSF